MDVTFILSAIIFTLLAIVIATSLLGGSSPAADSATANARSYFGRSSSRDGGGLERQNGHLPTGGKRKMEAENWSEISGSAHDHWDVVKSVHSVGNLLKRSVTEERDACLFGLLVCWDCIILPLICLSTRADSGPV